MRLVNRLARAVHDHNGQDAQDGQGLAEYALILALIAIVSILALIFLGGQISNILFDIANNI